MAWEFVEQVAPRLRRRPVAVAELPREMHAAQVMLDSIRRHQTVYITLSDRDGLIAVET
jgi:hypothetical protein